MIRLKLRLLAAFCATAGLAPATVILAAGPTPAAAVPAASAGRAVPGMSRTSTARTGLATAAGADPTDPTPLPADPDAPDASVMGSDNWAGWVDEADSSVELRYVTATFTVPTVSCSSANQHVGFWVGLDGFKPNETVEQVGVAVNCVNGSSGWAPVYDSFWEMYPNGPTENAGVSAGDSITASVYYNSSTGLYNLVLLSLIHI